MKVTILIPVYNVEQYLPQCIDSIINQTYNDLQIVLIDDGSKDGSWAVMQKYAAKDSRIEIYHQENQGVAITRNHLLEKIEGDYVLFVDSDDWIELDMVEFLIKQAEEEDAVFVTCSVVKNDTLSRIESNKKDLWNQEKAVFEFLRHVSFNGSLWNKLLKSSLLHNLAFHSGISYGEDALFTWQVLQRVDKVVVTDKQLYHYRMNESSISHGSYGEEKMSGHLVWKQLAEDTKRFWPQYKKVAEANYAISDMWQLYYAAKSNYPKDVHIGLFQETVRSHLLMIYTSGLINVKKMIFATVASFSYEACKLLV